MTTYYLPHLLSIEDYQVMSQRFWRIINTFPEFKDNKSKHKRTFRRIIRYRKDNISVIFHYNNNTIFNHHQIRIECKNNIDTFVVYDYDTPPDYSRIFRQSITNTIDESMLKGEVLDFIDDYCVLDGIDY